MSGRIAPGGPDDFLFYESSEGLSRIEVRLSGETIWLSLGQMVELFGRDKSVISRHIANIFEEGELASGAVVADFATTADDGKTYQVRYYNLDVIISVGYRVKSLRGTRFRIWATQRLREYIVKGFTMDDERLKQAGKGNFAELQAMNRRPMTMQAWIRKLDDFLALTDREILKHAGKISHEQARTKAAAEFQVFSQSRAKLPEPVDQHFDDAVNEAKNLAKSNPPGSPAKRPKPKKDEGEK